MKGIPVFSPILLALAASSLGTPETGGKPKRAGKTGKPRKDRKDINRERMAKRSRARNGGQR